MNEPVARAGNLPAEAPRRARPYERVPIAVRLIGGLLLLIGIGTLALLLPGAGAQGPLTLDQALFTSVSALCVVGLTIITPSQDLSFLGQLILLVEIQIGGVGFMVMVVLALRLLRRQVQLMDRLAIRDSLGLPEREQFAPILARVLITVATIEGVGAVVLWLDWRDRLDGVSAVWYAIFHAVSAFCNAGFDLFSGMPQFPDGLPRNPTTLLTMAGIIVLGGLGFPVLSELVHWRRGKRLSLNARLTVWLSLGLVAGGAIGYFIAALGPDGIIRDFTLSEFTLYSLFQSASARTAGFSLGDMSQLNAETNLLTIGLMFIGTAPASMGGGITTGTLLVLLVSVWAYARGYAKPQIGGRALAPELPRRAAAVLTVSIFVAFAATWLLLLTGNGTLEEAAFEAVSAFATTGWSLGLTPNLNLFGQIIIMTMMIWGRLGALTIILALARRRPTEPIQYPEASVLIG